MTILWAKTIILTILVPGVAVFLIPYFILRPSGIHLSSHFSLQILGILLIILGVCSYSWVSQAFARFGKGTPAPFDPPRTFVARGLYRYMRNSMYLGALAVLLGEAVLFNSWQLLVYAAFALTCLHFFVIIYEEPSLIKRFGDTYQQYLLAVPRWIPRFRSK